MRWHAVLGLVWVGLLVVSCAAPQQDPFALRLSDAAIERTNHKVVYDPAYVEIDYPMGDVAPNRGVCTDVVIRSYRLVGIDLQELVHEDMRANFHLYPTKWGLTEANPNIDHRRVLNLRVFFARQGQSLPVTTDAANYEPGDLVTWKTTPYADLKAPPHIGVVTHLRSSDGKRPLIAHNIGRGPKLEDMLFDFAITGHYRYQGPSPSSVEIADAQAVRSDHMERDDWDDD